MNYTTLTPEEHCLILDSLDAMKKSFVEVGPKIDRMAINDEIRNKGHTIVESQISDINKLIQKISQ